MKTGKALGLAKGDWCIESNGWPCRIMSDAHTYAPCCEVWGYEHECGSVYATDLRKVTKDQAYEAIRQMGFDPAIQYGKYPREKTA